MRFIFWPLQHRLLEVETRYFHHCDMALSIFIQLTIALWKLSDVNRTSFLLGGNFSLLIKEGSWIWEKLVGELKFGWATPKDQNEQYTFMWRKDTHLRTIMYTFRQRRQVVREGHERSHLCGKPLPQQGWRHMSTKKATLNNVFLGKARGWRG